MKKILLILVVALVITLAGCNKETEYQLSCTISGGGASIEMVYTYTDDELLSITMDGEDYEEFAIQEVFFNSRGKDAYISQLIYENESTIEMYGVEMSGTCVEITLD